MREAEAFDVKGYGDLLIRTLRIGIQAEGRKWDLVRIGQERNRSLTMTFPANLCPPMWEFLRIKARLRSHNM